MTYGQEHETVDCILQTFVDGHGRGRDSVRCEFLFADCIPSDKCPERLRLCADLVEQREREDRGE